LEYGTVAQENQTEGGQDSGRPFQRLEVLIRDWQNWKREKDPKEGSCGKLREEVCAIGLQWYPSLLIAFLRSEELSR